MVNYYGVVVESKMSFSAGWNDVLRHSCVAVFKTLKCTCPS